MNVIFCSSLGIVLLMSSCSKDKFASANESGARNLSLEVDGGEAGSGDQTALPGDDSAAIPGKEDVEHDDIIEVAGKDGKDPGESPSSDDATGPGKSVKSNKGKGHSFDAETVTDANDCGGALKSKRVKVAGSMNKVTLDSVTGYSLKLTGNQNLVTMDVKGQNTDVGTPGVCIFVAGNKNKIVINVGVQVGAIYVKARGNQALIEVNVAKDAKVGDLQLDFNGHSPQMILKGEGTYPCAAAALKGKEANVTCEK